MLIKNPEILITAEKPFDNDHLGREESAKILTQFLQTIDEPFVLAVDSSWGTGKTTFIKMWKEHLKKEGFPCLYFNAWENDFSDDPLISFIGEIQAYLKTPGLDPEQVKKAKRYYSKVSKIGSTLAKRIIPVALKVGTSGILDLDSVTEAGIAGLAAQVAEEKIKKYDSDKKSIKKFRENLEKYIDELSKEKDDGRKPLVFFIDELDRCRPTYAIELLERLKHLFNIKGIVFILALDKEQIAHSIRALYGIGMDAEGYLRRFIDLDYKLPTADYESFCKYLFNAFGFEDYLSARKASSIEKKHLLETFIWLAQIFELTLRELEQCFTQFSIVLRTTPPNIKLYPFLLTVLIALKAGNPVLYKKYINSECSAQEVLDYIKGSPKGTAFLNEKYGMIVEAYLWSAPLRYATLQSVLNRYTKEHERDDISESEKDRAGFIADTIDRLRVSDEYDFLDNVVKKIGISERFD